MAGGLCATQGANRKMLAETSPHAEDAGLYKEWWSLTVRHRQHGCPRFFRIKCAHSSNQDLYGMIGEPSVQQPGKLLFHQLAHFTGADHVLSRTRQVRRAMAVIE